MKTLEEVKNEIAISRSFASWNSCVDWHIGNLQVLDLMDLLASKYAKHCLQQAVERIENKIRHKNHFIDLDRYLKHEIDGHKSSIETVRQLLKELE